MLKNKSGITIITLIITIVILLILSSIFIATSLKALNEARITEVQSEIKAIEEAAMERYISYVKNSNNLNSQLIGKTPTSMWASATDCANAAIASIDFKEYSEQEMNNKKSKIINDIERDYEKYVKIITKSEATELGVEQFVDEDIFILNYATATAYGPIENDD